MADPIALARLAALAGGAPAPSARPPLLPAAPSPLRLSAAPATGRPTYAQLRAATPTAAPKTAKPRGLLKQLYDPIVGLPKGVAHIGAALGREIWHSPSVIRETFQHGPVQFRALRALHGDEGARQSILRQARLSPLDTELSQSLGRTASDVRHPTNFARAAKEGRIVDKLIEDITNLSLVAAPAAKLAGAGFEAGSVGARVAGGVERAAVLGGETANYPVSLARQGLTQATERGLPAVGRLAPALAERFPTTFRPESRMARQVAREMSVKAERTGEAITKLAHQEARGGPAGAPSLDEQLAAHSVLSGQAQNLRKDLATTGLPTEMLLNEAFSPVKLAESHLTPEAARIALDYLDNPESNPRVGRLVEVVPHKFLTPAERDYLEGKGQVRRGNPEQVTSNDPLTPGVERFAKKNRRAVQKVGASTPEYRAEAADFGEDWTPAERNAAKFQHGLGVLLDENVEPGTRLLDHPQLNEKWQTFLDRPDTYAALWRPRMGEAGRTRALVANLGEPMGAAGLPYRPAELAAAGVEARYLPHGPSELVTPKGARVATAPANEALTGDFLLSREQQRGLGPEAPMSLRTMGRALAKSARQAVLNEGYRRIINPENGMATTPTIALGKARIAESGGLVARGTDRAVIGREIIDQIEAEATARTATIHPKLKPEGAKFAREFAKIRGEMLAQRMGDLGLEAWPESGEALRNVKPEEIHPDTPFLPARTRGKVGKWWAPKELPLPLAAMERINRSFKGAVLPFSLRWQAGDALQYPLIGWVEGKVNPLALARRLGELRNLSPEKVALLDARIHDVSLSFDERAWLHDLEERAKPSFRHPIKAAQQPGWRLNQWINRTGRHAYYLEKLDRELTRQGISLEEAGRQVVGGKESPVVRKAIDETVDDANATFGAFDEMAPWEKRIARNLVPFWPWISHITKLSARLAVDDPIRVAWVMRVGQLGVDPDSQLPDYLRGALHTPLGLFDTNFLNPFADPTANSILTPEGAARSLSPAIKLASVATTGFDLNRLSQLSRPAGTGRLDQFGRPTATPLGLRPLELGYWLTQQTPQTRFLVNEAPQVGVGPVNLGPVARYNQGSAILRGGKTPIRQSRATEALRLVSIPVPTPNQQVREMLATIAKRRRAARRP